MASLPKTQLLDPSPRGYPGVTGAVAIPWNELAYRVFELPPPWEVLAVADVTGAQEALAELTKLGRNAEIVSCVLGADPDRYRLWSLPAFFTEAVANLAPARALCLGCGSGREAVWLASEGWQVTAVDRLPDALNQARALEGRYLGAPTIRWIEADLRNEKPFRGQYELVTLLRYWNRELADGLAAITAPGGKLIIEDLVGNGTQPIAGFQIEQCETREIGGRPVNFSVYVQS